MQEAISVAIRLPIETRMPNGKADAIGALVLALLEQHIPQGCSVTTSYRFVADLVGITKEQARSAIGRLVESGLVSRSFETVGKGSERRGNALVLSVAEHQKQPENAVEPPIGPESDRGSAQNSVEISNEAENASKPLVNGAMEFEPDTPIDPEPPIGPESDTPPAPTPCKRARARYINKYKYISGHETLVGNDSGQNRTEARARARSQGVLPRGRVGVIGSGPAIGIEGSAPALEPLAENQASPWREEGFRAVRQTLLIDPLHRAAAESEEARDVFDEVFDLIALESGRMQDRETQWAFSAKPLVDLLGKAEEAGFAGELGKKRVMDAVGELHGSLGARGKLVSFWLKDHMDLLELRACSKDAMTWEEMAMVQQMGYDRIAV